MVIALITTVYVVSRATSRLPRSDVVSTGEGEGVEEFLTTWVSANCESRSKIWRDCGLLCCSSESHNSQLINKCSSWQAAASSSSRCLGISKLGHWAIALQQTACKLFMIRLAPTRDIMPLHGVA